METRFMDYAPPWKRIAAALVDIALCMGGATILGFVLSILLAFLVGLEGMVEGGGTSPERMMPLYFLFFWIYHTGMESSPARGTLGKMALGIAVTTLSGERLTFGRAALRFLVKALTALPFAALLFFTARRQTLHDLAVGTVVIHREDGI
jgi:uncharacterized RDD family membrane protein YckC